MSKEVGKPIEWRGDSRQQVQSWPKAARFRAGTALDDVAYGDTPPDFKPMQSIGPGVQEIRIRDDQTNQYRVVLTARFSDAVYVLHAFQKKTQKTSQRDLDTAKRRFAELKDEKK